MSNSEITLGRVTSVFSERGKVYVSVQHDRPALQDEKIPFMSLSAGSVVTPQEGDLVEIYRLSGGGTAARFSHSYPQYPMPDVGENELVFRFDGNTELRFYRDSNNRYIARLSGDVKVEIDGASIELGTDGARKALVTDVDFTNGTVTKTTKTTAE